jgi:3-deoxy-D-manno-octulosonic-acid transferase
MFKYKCLQFIIYPIIIFFSFIRILLKKETFYSIKQKIFCIYDFEKINNLDVVIHFASIGELNSIKYITDNLLNQKILLTCTTLSSYNLAKKKYPQYQIVFLTFDFYWNVKKFLQKTKLKKFIWIDSEIWPSWLEEVKKNNIKNILVNARLSNKSYNNWIKISSFAKIVGKNYDLIFTKSEDDKKKFENLFSKKVYFYGNLKFNLDIKIHSRKENNICFASIHKLEFQKIIKIIKNLDIKLFDNIFIIPRHIQYSKKLKSILDTNLTNKIYIHDKFGDTVDLFDKSKVVFMGGSLFNHGGQNPLEALSRGCYLLTGKHISNFQKEYSDLDKLDVASIMETTLEDIAKKINRLIISDIKNTEIIDNYFAENTKEFSKLMEFINRC